MLSNNDHSWCANIMYDIMLMVSCIPLSSHDHSHEGEEQHSQEEKPSCPASWETAMHCWHSTDGESLAGTYLTRVSFYRELRSWLGG